MSAFARDDQGRLCAGGMPLSDIAASHGSPLYVYSGDGIRDDYCRFAAAVAPVDGSVHFALKANSALGVIGLLARHGAGADIVSGGEMARALAAGLLERLRLGAWRERLSVLVLVWVRGRCA